jgi:tetratricopeptide (TPR) repeat protein
VETLPDSWYRREDLALVYQALGRKADADAALRELLDKDSKDAPFEIAEVFAARGDTQSALNWLQRDYDLKLYGIVMAKVDPLLALVGGYLQFNARRVDSDTARLAPSST